MVPESFEKMLTGGHPNSLGRTIEVVDIVLADRERFDELYYCYFSDDEVVRLRTSNGVRRVSNEHPEWLVPYIDKLLNTIAKIDQASTQWTLAVLFETLAPLMSATQKRQAKKILKHNLEFHQDWIVLNNTMQTLTHWSKEDSKLRSWLAPHLDRLQSDSRKSVAKRATRFAQLANNTNSVDLRFQTCIVASPNEVDHCQ
ncbi:MAG: hypothetical protein AAF438_13365 [Pseudomonadota bacterium]